MVSYGIALALLSGLWPVGLAAMVAYLNRPPLRFAIAYLAGAAIVEGTCTALFLTALSVANVTPEENTRDGSVTLALGVLMIAFAAWVWRLPPRPPRAVDAGGERRRSPSPFAALAVGLLMWLPSPTYLAGLKQISDAGLSTTATALYGCLAVLCVLWIIEIPLILFVVRREATQRHLVQVDRWTRENGRALLVGLTGAIGVVLAVQGITTLT